MGGGQASTFNECQYGTGTSLGIFLEKGSLSLSGVRTWCGDVVDLPNFLGPADAFFFNGVFGNLYNQRDALLRAALMLRPGGCIVISHPMGRGWHTRLRERDAEMVPHLLPADGEELERLVHDLPLRVLNLVDEKHLYLACLQVSATNQGGVSQGQWDH